MIRLVPGATFIHTVLLYLALAASIAAAQEPTSGPQTDAQLADAIAAETFQQVNSYREENGLSRLAHSEALNEAARRFALFLAQSNQLAHGAGGTTPAERAGESGYQYCVIRENLGYLRGFSNEELAGRFVQGWIGSEEHHKNMLAENVSESGLAVARRGRAAFAVQVFGAPRSQRFEISLRNRTDAPRRVFFGSGGSEERISLPPGSSFMVESCFPMTFTLNGDQAGITVDREAMLSIEPVAGGQASLTRLDD